MYIKIAILPLDFAGLRTVSDVFKWPSMLSHETEVTVFHSINSDQFVSKLDIKNAFFILYSS